MIIKPLNKERHVSHLAQESHSMCVSRICSLVEVVISPLLKWKHEKYI